MAALESTFGEEADINPSLDRENLTTTECSEFQFNANSLTGQSQLRILEPHITEIIEGMSELEKTFLRFSAYGNTATHRNTMSGKNFYKMLKECGVMDGKVVTSTDVLIAFNEVKGMSELEKAFRKFAVYGDTAATGNDMTGKNFSKMLKECGVMDGKAVTSTDVDIVFNKVKTKTARNITYPEFQEAIKELSAKRFKGKSAEEALQATHQLMEGKEPGNVGATKSVAAGAVDRLTDTSKYTGSHKERFDESGKGKGIAGRADITDHSGYVGAYKGSGTYDKTH